MKTLKLLFISSALMLMSASLVAQAKPWDVPANFQIDEEPNCKE